MNAADHLDEAETLINMAMDTTGLEIAGQRSTMIAAALVHAVLAVALELGVPPSRPAGGGTGD